MIIDPPDPPPGSTPEEPFYIGTWPFFFFFISLEPKEAKSAKKSISINITDSPLKGNGKLWEDTEIVQNESEEVTEPTNTSEDNNEDDDEIDY